MRPTRCGPKGEQGRNRSGCHGPYRDAGFTLVELLVVLVILPLLIGALAEAIITVLDNTVPADPKGTAVRLSNSHDAQITSAYFVRDTQSAQQVTVSPTALCAPAGAGADQLLGLQWTSPTNKTIAATYFVEQNPLQLVRYVCVNGAYQSTSVISHDVFSSLASGTPVTPSYTCNGSLAGASICADGPAPAHTSYVSVTITCSDGTTGTSATCADGTLRSVDPTSGLGIQAVNMHVLENTTTNFNYQLTGTPRVANSNSSVSQQIAPPFIANGSVNLGNCGVLANGIVAIDQSTGTALNSGPQGGLTSTGIVTTGGGLGGSGTYSPPTATPGSPVTSPYDTLTEPPTAPVGGGYSVVTESARNWDPSTDTTVETAGVLKKAIYIVQNGMSLSKGLQAPTGTLFYVSGGDVSLSGNGAINLVPLTPNWEQPALPASDPEVVLWVSRNDTTGSGPNGAPALTLSGNGQATTIVGAVYAPTAVLTLNGGGVNSGVNVASLDIGSMAAGNGCGNIQFNMVVGPNSFTAGMTITPNSSAISTGNTNFAKVSVFGIGPRAPSGNVTFYWCGPVTPGLGCQGPDPSTGNPYTTTQVGTTTVALTQGATSTTPSTASSATMQFPPAGHAAGTYCFAATYAGDLSYGSASDQTTDGCFTVSGPPAPQILQPISGACYKNQTNNNCSNAWPGVISGSATDPGGPGIQSVTISVEDPNGKWFDPATLGFTATSPVNLAATDTSGNNTFATWQLLFPVTNLPANNADKGTYTVIATTTDKSGAAGLLATITFKWDG